MQEIELAAQVLGEIMNYRSGIVKTRFGKVAFEEPGGSERPIPETVELGLMLFDIAYAPDGSGRGTPQFFEARLDQGILRVPSVPAGRVPELLEKR